MSKNKKGIMLSQAFGAVLTLVLVAVLVIIAIYMFSILAQVPSDVSMTTTNESSSVLASGTYLKNYTKCGFSSPVITGLWNATSGAQFNVANATVSSTGLVKNSSSTLLTNAYISYTNNWKGQTCEAADNITTQFGNYPALVGLVGTIIFLALVIGVLVASFAFGGKQGV